MSYPSKKQDKELVLAYQKGILDERRLWKKVKKENAILKHRERKFKSYCFCKGNKLWRPVCAECQKWFISELRRRVLILKKKSKKKIISGTWDGILDSLLDLSFKVKKPTRVIRDASISSGASTEVKK